ncbi:hypothetical protein HPG69_003112, partial [Diceros bicornis minor]
CQKSNPTLSPLSPFSTPKFGAPARQAGSGEGPSAPCPRAPGRERTWSFPCPRAAATPQVPTRWRSRPGAGLQSDGRLRARARGRPTRSEMGTETRATDGRRSRPRDGHRQPRDRAAPRSPNRALDGAV